MARIGLIIPTYNAGIQFAKLLQQIDCQDCVMNQKLLIDSSSTDGTRDLGRQHGFDIIKISRSEFNHGGTRQRAFLYLWDKIDFVIFLTQDVLLAGPSSFSKLIQSFNGVNVGAAYGRQLPQVGASIEARLQRIFNYPGTSQIKSFSDKEKLGIKTPFLSDSFAAYRCSALQDAGGFPMHVAVCEDMYVGAKLLLCDWKIAYNADAQVYHSHEYSFKQKFCRYYLTGVFHHEERWIQQMFGHSEGEGIKWLCYQMKIAYHEQGSIAVIQSLVRTGVSYVAYVLGKTLGKGMW